MTNPGLSPIRPMSNVARTRKRRSFGIREKIQSSSRPIRPAARRGRRISRRVLVGWLARRGATLVPSLGDGGAALSRARRTATTGARGSRRHSETPTAKRGGRARDTAQRAPLSTGFVRSRAVTQTSDVGRDRANF